MSTSSLQRYLVWLALALPLAAVAAGYLRGDLFYGEVVHLTGEWSVRLMMLALAATPLVRLYPGRRWTRWLMRQRRAIGIASFAWAVLHTVVYAARQPAVADILDDALAVAYWTGWLAFVIFLALATTSNDASVRRLGRRWRQLHRLIYAAALLTFGHWILVAFDPLPAYLHLAVIAALEVVRFVKRPRTS